MKIEDKIIDLERNLKIAFEKISILQYDIELLKDPEKDASYNSVNLRDTNVDDPNCIHEFKDDEFLGALVRYCKKCFLFVDRE